MTASVNIQGWWIRLPLFLATSLFLVLLANGKSNPSAPVSLLPPPKIYLGIDVLEQRGFRPLKGKRVGLLTHPAGVNRDGVSSIEVLRRSRNVNLVTLFGPEHGIYGDEKANQAIPDRIDPRTGLPIYSLYGKYRKPTPSMLRDIEVLVVDLQDIGVRSYTYVSAMRLAMEACFQSNTEVIILDRPNPLGGLKVDGPSLEKRWISYIGAFRIPYVHGLTIGELTYMARSIPGWLEVENSTRLHGKLTVIPMKGWRRSMLWPETGLSWVPTSPSIPDLSAALGYAMTGLGAQIGGFKHGYGTTYPFRLLSYSGKEPEAIAVALQSKRISGLAYEIIPYRKPNGVRDRGLYLYVTNWNSLRPTEVSFYMMQLACAWNETNPFASTRASDARLYNKHVGSTAWWNAIATEGARVDVDSFVRQWQRQAEDFQAMSRPYWLYPYP